MYFSLFLFSSSLILISSTFLEKFFVSSYIFFQLAYFVFSVNADETINLERPLALY